MMLLRVRLYAFPGYHQSEKSYFYAPEMVYMLNMFVLRH